MGQPKRKGLFNTPPRSASGSPFGSPVDNPFAAGGRNGQQPNQASARPPGSVYYGLCGTPPPPTSAQQQQQEVKKEAKTPSATPPARIPPPGAAPVAPAAANGKKTGKKGRPPGPGKKKNAGAKPATKRQHKTKNNKDSSSDDDGSSSSDSSSSGDRSGSSSSRRSSTSRPAARRNNRQRLRRAHRASAVPARRRRNYSSHSQRKTLMHATLLDAADHLLNTVSEMLEIFSRDEPANGHVTKLGLRVFRQRMSLLHPVRIRQAELYEMGSPLHKTAAYLLVKGTDPVVDGSSSLSGKNKVFMVPVVIEGTGLAPNGQWRILVRTLNSKGKISGKRAQHLKQVCIAAAEGRVLVMDPQRDHEDDGKDAAEDRLA